VETEKQRQFGSCDEGHERIGYISGTQKTRGIYHRLFCNATTTLESVRSAQSLPEPSHKRLG